MWKSMINSSTAAKGNTDLLQKHFQVGVNNLTRSLEEIRKETILAFSQLNMSARSCNSAAKVEDQNIIQDLLWAASLQGGY